MKLQLIALASVFGLASMASAATLALDVADAQVNSDGTLNAGDYQSRIGEFFAPGGAAYVAPFQLPSLGTFAPGEGFTATNLRTQLFDKLGTAGDGLGNADLYGLGVRASSTVLASDYFNGALDAANTLLQDNFYMPDSVVRTDANAGPFTETSAAGDVALAAYLNLAYAGGANAGQFVFLRLNYDVAPIPTGNFAYAVLTANAGGTFEKPELSYTAGPIAAVPEPASLGLLGAAIGGMLVRRRRA